MYIRSLALVVVAAALMSPGCGGVTSPSQNQQETFSNVLQPGGITRIPNINVGNTGEYSVKITALSPTATAVVGVVWAQGANCEIAIQQNSFAQLNTPALAGAVIQKGAYCVAVFDSVGLTTAQNFTIVVSHP
jgi:hypothetical protein